MEEDIKILEEQLKYQDDYIKDKKWHKEHKISEEAVEQSKIIFKAIENLIARNKELEEEIEKDKMKIDFLVGKKLIEVEEHAKQVKIELDKIYIPKSKIKEKIEEYNKQRQKAETEKINDMFVNYIDCLQELLEEYEEEESER